MSPTIEEMVGVHRSAIYLLMRRYVALERPLLERPAIVDTLDDFAATPDGKAFGACELGRLLRSAQEALLQAPFLYLAIRPRVATWRYVQVHVEDVFVREIPASEYLRVKDATVLGAVPPDRRPLQVDMRPFERGFPRLKESRSIGRGAEFMNRYLAGRMFDAERSGPQRLFDFLRVHACGGRPLMLGPGIADLEALGQALRRGRDLLEPLAPDTPWADVAGDLAGLGFEAGWGRDAQRILEAFTLLSEVLEAPSPESLARLLDRIPMVFNIVILSPHGYFGQAGVLGKPDTGGQVVYILDQVRALEQEMRRSIALQGLDIEPNVVVVTRLLPEADGTTCDQVHEPILGTQNARILRVPFREADGGIVSGWISRFSIWPYLERFAAECADAISAELGGDPDLLVGNYSDGNLVASILSRRLGVTQCNIAHALEKTKYVNSDLQWQEHEEEHHFACQFTADLISMNAADFIITSTYQEIAGTRETVGQYESHGAYTLPGLYQVVAGIDPFDPRFNIVSPGADPEVFFPFHEMARRPEELRQHARDLLRGPESAHALGVLEDPERPLLMAMSRLDRIKNPTGLVEWYARDEDLRERANLLVIGGFLSPDLSSDAEEREQISRMRELLTDPALRGRVRWLEMQTDKNVVGEIYRAVADTRGAFVQPALFEAFGLTVIEAMACGLPTFATCYGGPLEIIEDGTSGFHIDPNHGDRATSRMREFLRDAAADPAVWDRLSEGSIERVASRYTWALYAGRMLRLARIYGFWSFMKDIERQESHRYLEMLFALMYRPLAASVTDGVLPRF